MPTSKKGRGALAAGAGRTGFLRRLDRQPYRTGALPAAVHWHSARGVVLRLAPHLPACQRAHAWGGLCNAADPYDLKADLWVVAALVLIAQLFPYVLPLFY